MADEEDGGGGIPEWVVTFGDMMSLLLTFFIMLVSLSEIKEEEKFQAMVESIKRQLGHTTTLDSMVPGPVKPRNSPVKSIANAGRSKRLDLLKGGDRTKAPVGENPTVRIIRLGERVTQGTVLQFAIGSAELRSEQQRVLRTQGAIFLGKPQLIEVSSHTSRKPLPADSPFSDSWQLAEARGRITMKFLIEEMGIEPERVRLRNAGPYDPATNESTPDALEQNSRVEVFMLDQTIGGAASEL